MSSFTTPLQYVTTGTFDKGRPIYRLTEEFDYCVGDLDQPLDVIHVPVGFLTDLASIPWMFRFIFHPDGPWAKAAVVHDFMCTSTPWISPELQDAIFLEAMHVLGVWMPVRYGFFLSVRIYRGLKEYFTGVA